MIFELCLIAMASGQMFKKVKLKDVDVLTLYQGKMTNGRRSSPVPQLSCKGGTAGCGAFVPEVVQCYNRGSDGLDIQWECKTDMDTKFRFGKISVSCEGYDYPEDPFILAGSCGLDYTIDRVGATNTGYNTGSNSYSSYQAPKSSTSTDDDWEINWVFVAIVCIICWAMWKNVTDENPNGNGIPPAGTEPSAPPPYDVPPAGSYPAGSYPGATHRNSGAGRQGWRPGFWSGMGTGWFGNQWWNSGNRGYNRGYTRHRSAYSNQSAYNQGYADGAGDNSPPRTRKSSSTTSSSSGTRTASGFGGTTRR